MENAIVKKEGAAVAVASEEYQLIKNIAAKGASDTEFKLLMHLANNYGLDPLARQIWCIKYGNAPAQIFTSRDGLLLIAHRSGQFNGMSKPEYAYDKDGKLESCTISVYRKDMEHPFTSTVFMEEYGGGANQLWKKMPRVMLLKVAESTALRKAFTITGLYTPEEMDQATPAEVVAPRRLQKAPSEPPPIDEPINEPMSDTAMLDEIKRRLPRMREHDDLAAEAIAAWLKQGNQKSASIKKTYEKMLATLPEKTPGELFDEI